MTSEASTAIQSVQRAIEQALQPYEKLWDADSGELNQTLLLHLVEQSDGEVLSLLFQRKELKARFFVKVKDVYVFKTNDFRFFVEAKMVGNSYTDYKNRIGLSDSKRFLKDSADVVLSFPYKDCVLAGGQSTDEGEDVYYEASEEGKYKKRKGKREEIFFNEVLAADEKDRLEDEKALINWARHTAKGKKPVGKLARDGDGTLRENLIIKGNNLLALHSLKKQLAGKVKLIYIDPPYNTGGDSFQYNDKFSHSTWLTFMKNRLDAAKQLLQDDGVIFVQIDHSPSDIDESPEYGYLQVLLDEIFGRKNYITNLVWKKKGGGSNTSDIVGTITESIFMYGKSERALINFMPYKRSHQHEDANGGYTLEQPIKTNEGEYQRDNLVYPVVDPTTKRKYYPPKGKRWTFGEATMQRHLADNKVVFERGFLYIKKYSADYKKGDNKLYANLLSDQGSLKVAKNELSSLGFNRERFSTPKPEALIKRIIDMSTKEGDIVLDYHLGSGTTAAVAHKMGRQYIGIEQMDYVEDIAVARLKKVIKGEQGGISKAANWQGGGDFVYCELAQWNESAKAAIKACETLSELQKLFGDLTAKYYLDYNLKVKEFNKIIKEDGFKKLPLRKQQQMFCDTLDLNRLYVNRSEAADKDYDISQPDQALTKKFYSAK